MLSDLIKSNGTVILMSAMFVASIALVEGRLITEGVEL